MNALWPRFLKSAYRKEPISSFILIVGAVDAVLGGVGERWTLLTFGLTIILLAAVIRWHNSHKTQSVLVEERARYVLPPSSERPPLPILTSKKQRR